MKTVLGLWKKESARIMSVVLALAAAGLIPGSIGKIIGVALPLLMGQAVRETVYAPDTVKEKVELAATSVAGQLSEETVGVSGQVTVAARAVVDGVVEGVIGNGRAEKLLGLEG